MRLEFAYNIRSGIVRSAAPSPADRMAADLGPWRAEEGAEEPEPLGQPMPYDPRLDPETWEDDCNDE